MLRQRERTDASECRGGTSWMAVSRVGWLWPQPTPGSRREPDGAPFVSLLQSISAAGQLWCNASAALGIRLANGGAAVRPQVWSATSAATVFFSNPDRRSHTPAPPMPESYGEG